VTSKIRAAAWTAFLAAVSDVYLAAGYARAGSRFLRRTGDVVVSAWYQRDPRQTGRDVAFCVNLEVFLLRLAERLPVGSSPQAVAAGENPHWRDRLPAPDGGEWWTLDSLNDAAAAEVAVWHREAARDLVLPRLAAHASEEAVLTAWRGGEHRFPADLAAQRISRLEAVLGGRPRSRALVPWAAPGPAGEPATRPT